MVVDIDINIDEVVKKATERAIKESKTMVEEAIQKRVDKYLESFDFGRYFDDRLDYYVENRIKNEVTWRVRDALNKIESGDEWKGCTEEERKAFYRGAVSGLLEALDFDPLEMRDEILDRVGYKYAFWINEGMRKPTKEKLADIIVKALEGAKEVSDEQMD